MYRHWTQIAITRWKNWWEAYSTGLQPLGLWIALVTVVTTGPLAADEVPLSPAEQAKIYHYHQGVSDEVWRQIIPHLLPAKHPVKARLDKIFEQERVSRSMHALAKKGGFQKVLPQRWTRLIVTKHTKMPGYVFKLYLDKQHPHRKQPDHYFWIRRCLGAARIRQEIEKHNWQSFFKVPRKWIYPLPAKPSPIPGVAAKNFILVEEDMQIQEAEWNRVLWGSDIISRHKLKALFYIVQKHGFWDCAKPENVPICLDGKIAFVDTQTFHHWPVRFERLFDVLSVDMLAYWKELIQNYEQTQKLPFDDGE